MEHKIGLMNNLDPELKSLESDLNEITDFSDMKAAKAGGKKILEHLNAQTVGANSPSATHTHSEEDEHHQHHHEKQPTDEQKAESEKKAVEASPKKDKTEVTVKKPEGSVADQAAEAITKMAKMRTDLKKAED